MDVTHPIANTLKLFLAGNNLNRYPAFNGQFRDVVYSIQNGAFVDNLEGLKTKIPGVVPSSTWDRRVVVKMAEEP